MGEGFVVARQAERFDAAKLTVRADSVAYDTSALNGSSTRVEYIPIDMFYGFASRIALESASLGADANASFTSLGLDLTFAGVYTKGSDGSTPTLTPMARDSIGHKVSSAFGSSVTLGGLFSGINPLRLERDQHSGTIFLTGTPVSHFAGQPTLQAPPADQRAPQPLRLGFKAQLVGSDGRRSSELLVFVDLEVKGCMDVRGQFVSDSTASFRTNAIMTQPPASDWPAAYAPFAGANSSGLPLYANPDGNFNPNASVPGPCVRAPLQVDPSRQAVVSKTVQGRSESTAGALQAALEAELAAGAGSATDEQLAAVKESVKGFVALDIPAGSLDAATPIKVAGFDAAAGGTALPLAEDTAKGEQRTILEDVVTEFGPCGQQFANPIQVCVFIGAADPAMQWEMGHASRASCSDPSLGFAQFQAASGSVYDSTTGKLCGYIQSFSIVAPMGRVLAVTPSLGYRSVSSSGGCPNDCSTHGDCTGSAQCLCHAGFTGVDCSHRQCPHAEAWAMAEPSSGTRGIGECSGAGNCNSASGQCECFDGFEGEACQRIACPSQCSGNGVCREIAALPAVVAAAVPYAEWDASRIQACLCDPGYQGSDCSLRSCPTGDDPMTECSATASPKQAISLSIPIAEAAAAASGYPAAAGGTAVSAWAVESSGTPLGFSGYASDSNAQAFWTPALRELLGSNAVSDATLAAIATQNIAALPQFVASSRIAVSVDTSATSRTINLELAGPTDTGLRLACPAVLGCAVPGCRPRYLQPRLAATRLPAASPHVEFDAQSLLDFGSSSGVVFKVTVSVSGSGSVFQVEVCSLTVTAATIAETGCSIERSAAPVPALLARYPSRYASPLGAVFTFTSATPTVGEYVFAFVKASCSSSVVRQAGASKESSVCSNRGTCDSSSGLCRCFEGFHGGSCSEAVLIE